jgi:hypothetical protein
VAHPINPPFVTPLVELCPAPRTDPAVVDRTQALMRQVGQAPIRLKREVAGFVANRMRAALIGAALRMVRDGVAAAEDVDVAIRDGIGLRWSFRGRSRPSTSMRRAALLLLLRIFRLLQRLTLVQTGGTAGGNVTPLHTLD